MITTNSLSAFTPEVMRPIPPGGVGAVTPVATPGRDGAASGKPEGSQRTLDSTPSGPAPSTNLPRGSLLDLRI